MHFISFEGEWKKSQVEMTTLKVRKQTLISFIFLKKFLCFNFNSSLTPKKLFWMAFVYVYIVINFYEIYH